MSTAPSSTMQGLSPRMRAPRTWTCQLGMFPPMRMPLETGGYLVERVDLDPAGGCAGFRAVWHEFLDPTSTSDGDVVLQLRTPYVGEADEPVADRVAVLLWMVRRQRWQRLRTWPQAGPGWPHQMAPWLHAALSGPAVTGYTATATSREKR